jgi:aminopeptidase N
MWFGDLVTMKWFDDVWMKEVFANFMAAKIVNPSFPDVNHDLRSCSRTIRRPIRWTARRERIRSASTLANLNEAGQLYGAIIYQKAPIVMRQLETMLGEQPFRDGLREYLKRYAFGNATWLDLVRILDDRTPENVAAWSRAWVEQRGRPEFTVATRTDSRGRLASITLTMTDPLKRGVVWPQRIRVALGSGDAIRLLPVTISGSVTEIPGGRWPRAATVHPAERCRASATDCSCWTMPVVPICSSTSRGFPTRSRVAAHG